MRVVLISHEYPPYIFGGIGIFVKDLATGLANIGVDVTVIAGKPMTWKNGPGLIDDDDRIHTIRLPYPNVVPRHMSFQLFNRKKLKEIICDIKPDVIHCQSGQIFPTISSIKNIAPVIVTFHTSPAAIKTLSIDALAQGRSFGDFFTGVLGYPGYEWSYREEYKNAATPVAVSKSLMNQLTEEFSTKGTFEYIHNGVDLTILERIFSEFPEKDVDKKKPTLLFGGRLFWSKGVLNLVDLAYLLEKKYRLNINIVIYGSGPMYNPILKKKLQYGLNNLVLKGFASRSTFLREMASADLVLLPSPFEAAPMMLIESMCLGKIPVVFNLPYALEFTKNGEYGIICNNVSDMAAKINDFFNYPHPENMERQIREFARANYNIIKTATAYSKLYSNT